MVGENYQELRGVIAGPPGTPYEGATFHLDIKIPKTYPFKPPLVKFLTKVWHPNISSQSGAICLDILGVKWRASSTLHTVLLSLQVLLSTPQPFVPLDNVVAKQYIENRPDFLQTARYWSHVHGGAPMDDEECPLE